MKGKVTGSVTDIFIEATSTPHELEPTLVPILYKQYTLLLRTEETVKKVFSKKASNLNFTREHVTNRPPKYRALSAPSLP